MCQNKLIRFISAAMIFHALASPGMAESSKDYAIKAQAAWSSFECSALADKSGDNEEKKRLFEFGYNQGREFIAALKAEKIKKRDLDSKVPMIVFLLLEGPNADFMLGRIFEAAQESALKSIDKLKGKGAPETLQKSAARGEFQKLNCRLIGNTQ